MAECRGFKNKLGTTIVSLIAKVTGAVAGNIATFNNDGEVVDSGKDINSLVNKSGNTSSGHFPIFNSEGNVEDSGKGVASLMSSVPNSVNNNIAVFDGEGNVKDVGIDIQRVYKLANIVTQLPSTSSTITKCLYLGPDTDTLKFGQTYILKNGTLTLPCHIYASGMGDGVTQFHSDELDYILQVFDQDYGIVITPAWTLHDGRDYWDIDEDVDFVSSDYTSEDDSRDFAREIEDRFSHLNVAFEWDYSHESYSGGTWEPRFALIPESSSSNS